MVRRRRVKSKLYVAGTAILVLLVGVWAWHRALPWNRARRSLDRGQAAEAVEILTKALEERDWSGEREENLLSQRARAFFLKGAIEPAEADYRRLNEKFPNNFDGLLGIGVINILRDQRIFARDYLEQARQLNPRDIRPYLLLVGVYRAIGDHTALDRVLRSAWGRFPNDRRVARLQADFDFDLGQYAAALKMYTVLHAAAPADRDLRARMALANLYSGHHRRAFDMLGSLRPEEGLDYPLELALAKVLKVQGRRVEANARFESLYNRTNAHVEAGLEWATGLLEGGRFEESESVLSRLGQQVIPLTAELFQSPSTLEMSDVERLSLIRYVAIQQNVGLAVAQGRLAACRGNLLEAERAFRRALTWEGDSYEAMTGMMDLARRRGDSEERLRWADRLVSAYREHPAALLARSEVYLDLGRNPDAAVDARQAADAYPELSQAQAMLSRAWLLSGYPEEARHAAERAVALNGGDPRAHFAMAEALAKSGDPRRAELSYGRALGLDPYWVFPRVRFARFLTAQGRFSEANQQLMEADRIEPRPGKRNS